MAKASYRQILPRPRSNPGAVVDRYCFCLVGNWGDQTEPVLAVDPEEDVGAQTLARYRYQSCLITAQCMALVVEGGSTAVICEWHEDYVVQRPNLRSELVSVKHHEPDQVNWTVGQLCSVGGLKHLFDRFRRLGDRCTYRLQTNESLRSGKGQPAELRDACTGRDPAAIASWAKVLTTQLGAEVNEIERFLSLLVLDDAQPSKADIEVIHIAKLVPDFLARLGADRRLDPSDAYERVRGMVERASATSPRATVLDALADPLSLSHDRKRADLLASKTIDLDRVRSALAAPLSLTPRSLLAQPLPSDDSRTRLSKKLEAGGFGPTAINGARRLRANWASYEREWRSDLPGDEDILEDLRAKAVLLAGKAEGAKRVPAAFYGLEMRLEIEQLIAATNLSEEGWGDMTDDVFMGLVYDRTMRAKSSGAIDLTRTRPNEGRSRLPLGPGTTARRRTHTERWFSRWSHEAGQTRFSSSLSPVSGSTDGARRHCLARPKRAGTDRC